VTVHNASITVHALLLPVASAAGRGSAMNVVEAQLQEGPGLMHHRCTQSVAREHKKQATVTFIIVIIINCVLQHQPL